MDMDEMGKFILFLSCSNQLAPVPSLGVNISSFRDWPGNDECFKANGFREQTNERVTVERLIDTGHFVMEIKSQVNLTCKSYNEAK